MKISIIGSGFVGTAIGKGLIELGNGVIFYDINADKSKWRNIPELHKKQRKI
jgi:UDP-glucose 6-dehydrogenase